MNIKVLYLPYFEGVYHTRMIETFSNVNACMVHTMHMVDASASSKRSIIGELDVVFGPPYLLK